MMMDKGRTAPQDWAQCHTCKRWFLAQALETHAKICLKVCNKKRKVFDSSKQRAEGTDLPLPNHLKPKLDSSADKANPTKKTNNWRKTHEDFIATIRAAKALAKVMKEGGPLPPPPPPTINPDYIQCPCCQRRFNETAAERHIKFCQEKAARLPQKSNVEDAKKVLTRTLYKPPPPVKKSNSSVSSNLPSSSSSNLPHRSTPGQSSGIPSMSFSSAGQLGNNLGTPSSSLDTKMRAANHGQASVRNVQPRVEMTKRRQDAQLFQNDVDGMNEVERLKTKFCYKCGSRYPVESAKFCCECGVKRMNM